MKRKVLIAFLFFSLLATGCGLDTSGEWSPSVWIDAPQDGAFLVMDTAVAVMAHVNTQVDRLVFMVNGVPIITLGITQVSDSLWEGTGYWTPVSTGTYTLSVRAVTPGGEYESDGIEVLVLETRSFPMEAMTPTPSPTPTVAATPWPPAQVNFWADSLSLMRGGCTTLHWEVTYATAVYLNREFVAQIGSRQVCPQDTTTFTLNIEAPAGNVEKQLIVTVNVPTVVIIPTVTIPVPPDTSGPSVTNLSHSPEFIFDGSTCGLISANISASVSDPSDVSKVVLYYRVVKGPIQGGWRNLTMSHTSGKTYQASLGPEELLASLHSYGGGTVEYYVRAWDSPGNMAQSGGRSFEVKICLI